MYYRKSKVGAILGVVSLLLIVISFVFLLYLQKKSVLTGSVRENRTVEFVFEPEVLVYSGDKTLNLLEGVTVLEEGVEVSLEQVDAVLASADGNHRQIRYSFFDQNQYRHTAVRELRLNHYTGPSLTVDAKLMLQADDLAELPKLLAEEKKLYAEDGFGQNLTEQVRYVRKKTGNHCYEMTFSVRNMFADETSKTVEAVIEGDVEDIVLELTDSKVCIEAGEACDLRKFVKQAMDPELGSLIDNVIIEGFIDFYVPGEYHLVYQVYSFDETQVAEEPLTVEIVGGVQEPY